MAKMLKVGDKVSWRGSWGDNEAKKVTVIAIEVNCVEKYGDEADEVAWAVVQDPLNKRGVTVDLDNSCWAYGFQISPID